MKIKSLLAVFSFFTFLFLISCDDDLNTIGSSIQPPNDTISTTVDTIPLVARTTSMFDSVYARTINGVLGKYEDPIFGTTKSDYLCQFSYPSDLKFKDTFKKMDSVQFSIDYIKFYGDTLAPMGLSVYQVTSPLQENYYTNVDPTKFCDMTKTLANQAYTIAGSKLLNGYGQRVITADLGVSFGEKFYDGIKNGTIHDKTSFNEFFPGVYVTTNFGSGSLIQIIYTSVDMYYTYTYQKDGATRDTTALLSLSATQEVIQLNHVKNTNPEELFEEGTGATYMKTPAGVYPEVVFPIGEIGRNMKKNNMTTINSALFSLKGYTEKENDPTLGGLSRPSSVLLINKDSIGVFFPRRDLYDNKITFSAIRNSSSNIYSFGNISAMIKYYLDKNVENVTFAIIPIEIATIQNPSTGATEVSRVYNYMLPSTAILRNDINNMKLELAYSKF